MIDETAVKRAARRAWWRRNAFWVFSPFIIFAVWFAYTLYRGVEVYARNQGNPWNNFDTNLDGKFSRAEVDELYGMSGEKFTFCDEDGDGLLTPREYSGYCSRTYVPAEKEVRSLKARRALYLLEHPSESSVSILAAYGNEDGNIYRVAEGLFWEEPELSRFGLDRDGDGVITEPELRGALGLPPARKGFFSRFRG